MSEKKLTGEASFEANINKLRKEKKDSRQGGFRAWLLRLLSGEPVEDPADREMQLQDMGRELAAARYDLDKLGRELVAAKKENEELRQDAERFMSRIDMDDYNNLRAKARNYELISTPLMKIIESFSRLEKLKDGLDIRRIIDECRQELSATLDNFQKIKVLRDFLQRLSVYESIRAEIEEFLSDKEKIKEVEKAEKLLNDISNRTDPQAELGSYMREEYSRIRDGIDRMMQEMNRGV